MSTIRAPFISPIKIPLTRYPIPIATDSLRSTRFGNFGIVSTVINHLIYYPTPITLSYNWSFGSLAGICLMLQIVTGLFLTMHYVPASDFAFASIEHIMRDVNYGWLIRYMHSNGASLFFILVYLHIARGMYYRLWQGRLLFVWLIGVVIFLLLMATAFMGYILPWGQMSFWGATVITNLFSTIPVFGKVVVKWLWGGYSVGNPTLARFYSLHYLLPFIIVIMVFVHLILLHWSGSTSPTRKTMHYEQIGFFPYFYLKDLFSTLIMLIVLFGIILVDPEYLGHPDNYIPANPMSTPAHIVPEWYFLPFYAMLRSIPNKLAGVLVMFAAIIALAFLPLFHAQSVVVGSGRYFPNYGAFRHGRGRMLGSKRLAGVNVIMVYNRAVVEEEMFEKFPYATIGVQHQRAFGIFLGTVMLLGWLGAQPAKEPYISVSLYLTFYYFYYLTFGQIWVRRAEILNTWAHFDEIPRFFIAFLYRFGSKRQLDFFNLRYVGMLTTWLPRVRIELLPALTRLISDIKAEKVKYSISADDALIIHDLPGIFKKDPKNPSRFIWEYNSFIYMLLKIDRWSIYTQLLKKQC